MADRGSHARHDRFAIAASIGGGLVPAPFGSCPSCGALHADLLAIRTALRLAWTPTRHRDMHLSPRDAARLGPTRWWRLTRRLGLSLSGLGLAGLLLTAVPLGMPGATTGEASAPGDARVVRVPGQPGPPSVKDAQAEASGGNEPLTALSIGLLGAGGALFVVRRRASRAGAMR